MEITKSLLKTDLQGTPRLQSGEDVSNLQKEMEQIKKNQLKKDQLVYKELAKLKKQIIKK